MSERNNLTLLEGAQGHLKTDGNALAIQGKLAHFPAHILPGFCDRLARRALVEDIDDLCKVHPAHICDMIHRAVEGCNRHPWRHPRMLVGAVEAVDQTTRQDTGDADAPVVGALPTHFLFPEAEAQVAKDREHVGLLGMRVGRSRLNQLLVPLRRLAHPN